MMPTLASPTAQHAAWPEYVAAWVNFMSAGALLIASWIWRLIMTPPSGK